MFRFYPVDLLVHRVSRDISAGRERRELHETLGRVGMVRKREGGGGSSVIGGHDIGHPVL